MSINKKESSAISAVLFLNVKGEPMHFFIRPGPSKVQLRPLISSGGGVLCRTQEPNAILLADPGDITAAVEGASHFYISTQYIHDCVAQNQQLDIEKYRFSNVQPIQTTATPQKQRGKGRMGYSLQDDTAILNFIAKHQNDAKGNRVWQQMERQGITSHSWQSMKYRFLKHLQHKLDQSSPESKKSISQLKKSSSSEEDSSQSTPKKTPRKKAQMVLSSDSDVTQISPDEAGTTEQPDLHCSPEEINSPKAPATEKRRTYGDETRKEAEGDGEQQQDGEQSEVSPKRARTDTASTTEDTSAGLNDQPSTPNKKQSARKPSALPGRKLGILQRAAREFEDSQAADGSQEDQPLSQPSVSNASDTDECQILAARKRAIREQEVNSEQPNDSEAPAQTHRSTPSTEDDVPGPSSAALPITSNAHTFLFQQESQEELSQPSEEDQLSQSLLETEQHVVRLMQESKKDLVEVMKALLKTSGDVTLARSYLLEGYDLEVHGPAWTQHDDKMLICADSLERDRLHEKYGAEKVSRRAAFLKADP